MHLVGGQGGGQNQRAIRRKGNRFSFDGDLSVPRQDIDDFLAIMEVRRSSRAGARDCFQAETCWVPRDL